MSQCSLVGPLVGWKITKQTNSLICLLKHYNFDNNALIIKVTDNGRTLSVKKEILL